MDRRHFGKTALALSSSLLIPKISNGKIHVRTDAKLITDIVSLYFFRNLFNDPFNLVIRRDVKKAQILEHIKIKEISLYLSHQPSNTPFPQSCLSLLLVKDVGYVFLPVQRFANGYIAHLHNVEVNLFGTLIIKKDIPASKIGSLNITTKGHENEKQVSKPI